MADASSSSHSTALRDETVLWGAGQPGSARDRLRERRVQRFTASTLILLAALFAATILWLAGPDQMVADAWLASPVTALLMTLFVLAGLVHALVRTASAILDTVSTLAVLKLFLDR
jgi:succinate dehydrogenase hydrophobic anchor subunit